MTPELQAVIAFLGRGVLELHDPRQRVALHHQPPVACRVFGVEAQHDHVVLRPCGAQAVQRFGRQKRRVGVKDDRVAVEALQRGGGLQHRVAGAVLLLLPDADGLGVGLATAASTASAP
jgi:hypothetical protein